MQETIQTTTKENDTNSNQSTNANVINVMKPEKQTPKQKKSNTKQNRENAWYFGCKKYNISSIMCNQ